LGSTKDIVIGFVIIIAEICGINDKNKLGSSATKNNEKAHLPTKIN
jgi:hypothetical protein